MKFFWSLLAIPAAEAAAATGRGRLRHPVLQRLIRRLHSGEGELGEALRPLFIDYLRKHPDARRRRRTGPERDRWSERAREQATLRSLELFGMRFGLDRMRRMMTVLGSPERRFEAIHVLGTNGKSSTTRMTAAILERHGLRTGAYTLAAPASPTASAC